MTEKVQKDTGIKGGTNLVFGVQGRLPWEIISKLPRVKDVKCAGKHEPLFLDPLRIKKGVHFTRPLQQSPVSANKIKGGK